MNIYTVTNDFHGAVSDLFAEHGDVKVLPDKQEEYRSLDIDLLIFTGGEDVEPERYGLTDKSIRFNPKRDAREFSVFSQVQTRRVKAKKVLGICRGLQVINVGMGGTLIPDIFTKFGIDHDHIHPLIWKMETPLSILSNTNSMHHQGIGSIGNKSIAKILAVEPRTMLIETIMWENQYLAVQFHPEFFPDGPMRRDVAAIIASWCKGENPIVAQKDSEKKISIADYGTYETAGASSFPIENSGPSIFSGSWSTLDRPISITPDNSEEILDEEDEEPRWASDEELEEEEE